MRPLPSRIQSAVGTLECPWCIVQVGDVLYDVDRLLGAKAACCMHDNVKYGYWDMGYGIWDMQLLYKAFSISYRYSSTVDSSSQRSQ
jgi:hypothetical protein